MFDKTATYHKTAAGSEAIATRSSALTARLRSMLIMVDGKRTCDELAKIGDVETLLPQLADIFPNEGTSPTLFRILPTLLCLTGKKIENVTSITSEELQPGRPSFAP